MQIAKLFKAMTALPSDNITEKMIAADYWIDRAKELKLTIPEQGKFVILFQERMQGRQDFMDALEDHISEDIQCQLTEEEHKVFTALCAGVVGVAELAGTLPALRMAFCKDSPAQAAAVRFRLEDITFEPEPETEYAAPVMWDRQSPVGALVCELVRYGRSHARVQPGTPGFDPLEIDLSD